MDNDRLLTADEAAEVLRVSRNQIFKLLAAGKIKATKVGKKIGIRPDDLLNPQ